MNEDLASTCVSDTRGLLCAVNEGSTCICVFNTCGIPRYMCAMSEYLTCICVFNTCGFLCAMNEDLTSTCVSDTRGFLCAVNEELHDVLRPYLLRRTKCGVLKDLPEKSDVILYHGLSKLQKKLYKAILTKDIGEKFVFQE